MNLWRRAGLVGLVWGISQGTIILLANFAGLLPPPQGPSRFLGVLPSLSFLSVFAAGAVIGVILDEAEVTMRAFPLSQLIGSLLGWAPLVMMGRANFADLDLLFALAVVIVFFLLAAVGGLVGGFLIGMYEGAMPRSLDRRILVLSLAVGLVPVYLLHASSANW